MDPSRSEQPTREELMARLKVCTEALEAAQDAYLEAKRALLVFEQEQHDKAGGDHHGN